MSDVMGHSESINSMTINLIPIGRNRKDLDKYAPNSFIVDIFNVYSSYYDKIGFTLPWIGYFAESNNELIGVGGYKGTPKNGRIEIAYGTDPGRENQGIGTTICKLLTEMALKEDPNITVTARTLMESNASTKILKKNSFQLLGKVDDPEDGIVWEWKFIN